MLAQSASTGLGPDLVFQQILGEFSSFVMAKRDLVPGLNWASESSQVSHRTFNGTSAHF